MAEKPKLAMYWATSCGGCEISVVNLHERLLEVDAAMEFVFCPCLLDAKRADLEAMPDGSIALTLCNGAIRTSENEEMAHLLRRKSKTLVAFGSCSAAGCIPGLSNLSTAEEHFQTIYGSARGGTDAVRPTPIVQVPEGELHLPVFSGRVRTLSEVVDVDYSIPGCPPESGKVWEVLTLVLSGAPLPERGATLGGGTSSVCGQCARVKHDKRINRLRRIHEFVPDTEQCLLEQGVVCMGIATRDGCGALCPAVNMPCIGCYGPTEGGLDQGARMIAALGSVIDIAPLVQGSEDDRAASLGELDEQIPDLAGTFYKFSLPGSLLKGVRR